MELIKAGLIDDERDVVNDKGMANDIIEKTKQKYVTMFSDLKEKIERSWL